MSETLRMFAALYGALVSGWIELRPIRPNNKPGRREWFPVTQFASAAERCIELADTHNVYFGVLPRTRDGGSAREDVAEAHVVWADIDTSEAAVKLLMFDLPPSIVVSSGSVDCFHAYWLLEEPVAAGIAEDLNARLAASLASDPAVKDASRILRPAGTLNHKHSPPKLVSLEESIDRRYSTADLESALPALPTVLPVQRQGAHAGKPSPQLRTVLAALHDAQSHGHGWMATCPAHDDRTPSLSFREADDGTVVIHCFAGCPTEDVLEKLGLSFADLFPQSNRKRRSAQSRVIEMVDAAGVELFHDAQSQPYAMVPVDGHLECHEVSSSSFHRWLRGGYYKRFGSALGSEPLRETTELLAAQAQFDGEKRPVHRRVGGNLDQLCIDLGDPSWRVAVIRSDGRWEILDRSPVAFARDQGMLALPEPERGGSLEALRDLVNLPGDVSWTQVKGGLLAMFHPSGPYFVTLISGVAGSGKSSLARYMAKLVDPFAAQFLGGEPRAQDLLLAAARAWLVGIDNVSQIRRQMSDLLCVLSTGIGDRRRALYSNGDVFAVEAKRPTMVTSIGRVATRPDLVDRGNPIVLERRISDENRQKESVLDAMFEAQRGALFGAILEALAGALLHLPDTNPPALPRMADVTAFVTAAEHGMGGEVGAFYEALTSAQRDALKEAVEASPFIEAVIAMMRGLDSWTGSATDLWTQVKRPEVAGARWPSNASVASKELDEHEIALVEHEITVERLREPGRNRDRRLRLVNRRWDAGRAGTGATDATGA